MKKRKLIYLASTAILLAATASVAYAEDNVSSDNGTLDVSNANKNQTNNATVSAATKETVVASTSENEVAEENKTDQTSGAIESAKSVSSLNEDVTVATEQKPVVSENNAENSLSKTEESLTPSNDKTETATAPQTAVEKIVPKVETSTVEQGNTAFKNQTDTHAISSVEKSVQSSAQTEIRGSSFVDVSSHNGNISVEDYRTLSSKGISGVVVKLTEGTTYTNPYAESQIRNAQAAGLKVSTYAFSRYTSEETARAEARHYVSVANRLGLSKATVMVNDMEDPKMQNGINQTTQAWADEMRKQGYANLMYYTSASWLDRNNLSGKGPVNTAQFGYANFWVAQYPTAQLSLNSAKSLKYNSGAGAWQFTSQAQLLTGKHVFDQSVDYTGRFTVSSTDLAVKGTVKIIHSTNTVGEFDVVISDIVAPQGLKRVYVPTWSNVNGQDDIQWYIAEAQSDGTYRQHIKASNHKNSIGEYHVHVYYLNSADQLQFLTSKQTLVSNDRVKANVSIQNNNKKTGEFDVVISNIVAPQGLKRVYVPTWSSANGQD
ncbi:MAG: GH25 family lysozyme, partial [Streptococcus sp.]|nr:GH25 family lysozyme [Streptococcus sp.]